MVKSKKRLAITLSHLGIPNRLDVGLEQYITPSEIAADMVWTAKPNITGKIVADLGCGNGILGIGASLIGAKKVFLVDVDKQMTSLAKNNASQFGVGNAIILNKDVTEFMEKVDVVIQNPPFGIQRRKADKSFLETAFQTAKKVYSLHAPGSEPFLTRISAEYGFTAQKIKQYDFVLGRSYRFHTKPTRVVKAEYWLFSRK